MPRIESIFFFQIEIFNYAFRRPRVANKMLGGFFYYFFSMAGRKLRLLFFCFSFSAGVNLNMMELKYRL